MATDPRYQPITADEFLEMDFGTDRKFELDRGVIRMMTGGSFEHARVSGNIHYALRWKLRGTACQPMNSDMGVRISEDVVRYPDVSVFCGKDRQRDGDAKDFSDPRVIFEVLSPSTTTFDQGTKLAEYQGLASVDTIVFVDPVNRLTRTHQRTGTGWSDTTFAQPHDVALPALDVTLTEAEIFAVD